MFHFLLASSTDYPTAILSVLGIAGLAGGSVAYFRSKSTKSTIDLLEQSVRIERNERQALEARCKQDSIALEAKITVLTERFAEIIAEAVVRKLP